MFVYFVYDDSVPSIDMFKQDWTQAFDIAYTNKRVKQIHFKNNKEQLFTWIEKGCFSERDREFERIVNDFSSFDITEIIYDDSVLVRERVPAQYRSDTYKNGRLLSSYTSDWDGGT